MTQEAEATADGVDVDLGPEAISAAKFTKDNQEREALCQLKQKLCDLCFLLLELREETLGLVIC